MCTTYLFNHTRISSAHYYRKRQCISTIWMLVIILLNSPWGRRSRPTVCSVCWFQ